MKNTFIFDMAVATVMFCIGIFTGYDIGKVNFERTTFKNCATSGHTSLDKSGEITCEVIKDAK